MLEDFEGVDGPIAITEGLGGGLDVVFAVAGESVAGCVLGEDGTGPFAW